MNVHVNHVEAGRAARVTEVVACLLGLFETGKAPAGLLDDLEVFLDWVQYRTHFREAVTLRRCLREGALLAPVELGVDLRQVDPATLGAALFEAIEEAGRANREGGGDGARPGWLALEPFGAISESVIWQFNRMFWQHLPVWERDSGRGYEKALPTGTSDGHNPESIRDSVTEFRALLVELQSKGQLPEEVFVLEIGVGTAERAVRWLDVFLELDRGEATGFYPRLRFLLADYAMPTLNRAMERLTAHRDVTSFLAVDALDPFKSLSFLRYKVLYIHLTNVYDNLPTDELALRDGKLYRVEARASLRQSDVERLSTEGGFRPDGFTRAVKRLLEIGPEHFSEDGLGVAFWRGVWSSVRLEERMVAADNPADAGLPAGVRPSHIESLIRDAPGDLRFQLSSGAAESFLNTIPLLHPRGYLQVQDIFVEDLADYLHGFRGPGKMDGSIVNWVNGALLREVGEQAGYNVHFVPFRYREGSRTSVLYTTQRE
jgi:hypothetical protein